MHLACPIGLGLDACFIFWSIQRDEIDEIKNNPSKNARQMFKFHSGEWKQAVYPND